MATARSIALANTEYPPCALRFDPLNDTILFLGTYQLEKRTGKRHGSIDIFRFWNDELNLLRRIPTESAVLDLKFSPHDDSLLVSAHSTGDLRVWKVERSIDNLQPCCDVELLHHAQLFEQEVLITSLIFHNSNKGEILVTMTDGYAALLKLTQTGFGQPQFLETPHELQCWTGAFGEMNELCDVVFTGGDDGCLIAHDTRTSPILPVFQSRRLHEAGVVAIQTSTSGNSRGIGEWQTSRPYSLWTGSYDDNLRSIDLRIVPNIGIINGVLPRVIEKVKLGGGVWRFVPSSKKDDDRLLTCCMYDGARIIGAEGPKGDPVVERYYKGAHDSMVYGCDWSPVKGEVVSTCSFYDCTVQLWSPDEIVGNN